MGDETMEAELTRLLDLLPELAAPNCFKPEETMVETGVYTSEDWRRENPWKSTPVTGRYPDFPGGYYTSGENI
jgi:hypothetical protein